MPDKYLIGQDELLFFNQQPAALPLYETFAEELFARYPDAGMRVQKTQITFTNPRVFACISFLRARKKAELPDPYMVLTLGLPEPLDSPRTAAQTEPYPGRWTVHIVIGSAQELDKELFSWLQRAYLFSQHKRPRLCPHFPLTNGRT